MSLSAATGLEREALTGTKSTQKISRRRFAGSATAAVGVVAAGTYVKPEMKALGLPTAYAQVSPIPARDVTITIVPPGSRTPEGSITPTTTGTPGTPTTITPTASVSVSPSASVSPSTTGTASTVTPTVTEPGGSTTPTVT